MRFYEKPSDYVYFEAYLGTLPALNSSTTIRALLDTSFGTILGLYLL